jgi:hypothetical protein
MLIERLRIDDYVIQVDEADAKVQARHHEVMRRWNVAPALHSPSGIVLKRYIPREHMNAVLSISDGLTFT